MQHLLALAGELIGFPRHLSQHVGGFVISRGPLAELVPVENAAMAERTVIQWDKDDLEALGLLKVDVLALGMLTAIRRALSFVSEEKGKPFGLSDIPREDPAVYEMIQQADTVGVFQIESRAQMSMLPRLKPANFYDLVIEVAIVRPGPIQGGMVHPYLRRRQGLEPVDYPSEAVEQVLERTLGVPIFQEQVMQLAMVAAGFTPGEADQLRRAMAAWKKKGGLEPFEEKLKHGMQAQRLRAGVRRFDLPPDPGLRRLRLSRIAFGELRAARVLLGLAQVPPPGGVPRRAAEQPADGLLQPLAAGPGRAPAWRGGAAGGRRAQPVGLHAWKDGARPPGPAHGGRACRRPRASASSPAGPMLRSRISRGAPGLNRKDLKCLAAAGALQTLAGHRRSAHWAASGVEKGTAFLPSAAGTRTSLELRASRRRRGDRRRLPEPRPYARTASARTVERGSF